MRGDYGYGKMQNVVTSLEFERILSATGPYEGEILRPSDGKHPHKIAWIQCVGSRQVIPGGNTYCSSVCCAYTQKQVILSKDHYADLDATVFHNDIRAFSKDFERYQERKTLRCPVYPKLRDNWQEDLKARTSPSDMRPKAKA